jgi:hypothetical protein
MVYIIAIIVQGSVNYLPIFDLHPSKALFPPDFARINPKESLFDKNSYVGVAQQLSYNCNC